MLQKIVPFSSVLRQEVLDIKFEKVFTGSYNLYDPFAWGLVQDVLEMFKWTFVGGFMMLIKGLLSG